MVKIYSIFDLVYWFSGEKYELAKKVNIKLVNHRWLEDW